MGSVCERRWNGTGRRLGPVEHGYIYRCEINDYRWLVPLCVCVCEPVCVFTYLCLGLCVCEAGRNAFLCVHASVLQESA